MPVVTLEEHLTYPYKMIEADISKIDNNIQLNNYFIYLQNKSHKFKVLQGKNKKL